MDPLIIGTGILVVVVHLVILFLHLGTLTLSHTANSSDQQVTDANQETNSQVSAEVAVQTDDSDLFLHML